MQHPKIFLVGDDAATLLPMEEAQYDAERILQNHLAQSPDLLPGDQINQEDPRRWLLVKQEAGIPAVQNGADHWSLDHIFVDQDGIPSLVECKRSGDPRLRREVVAQMLDYAANGTAYWPQGKLRLLAEETARHGQRTLEECLQELLQLDNLPSQETQDGFWENVDANMAAGKLRLLFVADAIPRGLRRLVEFLNTQMRTVEVLAVELKQFVNPQNGLKAFVPRLIGQTAAIQEQKSTTKKKFASITSQLATYPQRALFEKIVRLAQQHGHIVEPGIANFSLRCRLNGRIVTYGFGKPTPAIQFYSEYLLADHPKIVHDMEQALMAFGYTYSGKYTITLPLETNADTVLRALDKAISILDNYRKELN